MIAVLLGLCLLATSTLSLHPLSSHTVQKQSRDLDRWHDRRHELWHELPPLHGGTLEPSPRTQTLRAASLLSFLLSSPWWSPPLLSLYKSLPPLRPFLAAKMRPLQTLGPLLGPSIFLCIFSIYAAVGLSTTPVELISGFTFPLPVACLVNILGKGLGSVMAFLVTRYGIHANTPRINAGVMTTERLTKLALTSPIKTVR